MITSNNNLSLSHPSYYAVQHTYIYPHYDAKVRHTV